MGSSPNILLVIQNGDERELIQSVLSSSGTKAQVTDDRASAKELFKRRKFSGIFLGADWSLDQAFEMVGEVRRSASNQKTPVVLIADPRSSGKLLQAYKVGVTFTLLRPLSKKKLAQTVSLVRGSMLAEQRKYQRVSVTAPVRFRTNSETGEGESIDISRTGMLFRTAQVPKVNQSVEVKIPLPGDLNLVSAVGDVVRVDQKGCTAVRFTSLPVDDLERLKRFLESQTTAEGR